VKALVTLLFPDALQEIGLSIEDFRSFDKTDWRRCFLDSVWIGEAWNMTDNPPGRLSID